MKRLSARSVQVALAGSTLLAGLSLAAFVRPGFLLQKTSNVAAARPDLALDFVPSAEQKRTIEGLRSRLSPQNPHFTSEDARQKSNAKLFTYMAGSSDERLVIEASLEAIQSAYSPRSTRKEAPDADLDRVLIKHLGSEQPEILAKALAAAQVPLLGKDPSEKLIGAIVRLSSERKDAVTRYAALETLGLLRAERRSPEVIAVFESALTATEPQLVASALGALESSVPALPEVPGTLGPRALELTHHADPGVRGTALRLVSELDGIDARARAIESALAALKDQHPYVRGVACDVLGRLGHRPAVHELVKLVDDQARSRYEIVGFGRLDGKPGTLGFGVPGRLHVSEAAMYAISTLSPGELNVAIGGPQQTDESLAKSAELTKAWYEKTKAQIPRDSAPSSP